MKKDPIFDTTQFPLYLTIRQKELLREASREMRVSISELVREAIHYWLKERAGKDDGQMFDSAEFVEGWKRGVSGRAREVALQIERERDAEMERERERKRAKEKEIIEMFTKENPAKGEESE